MSELGERPSPEIKQNQLISIFKAAPKREAAGGRLKAGIPSTEVGELLESAVTNGIQYIDRAETPAIKLVQLDDLLAKARITEASKGLIKTSFQASYVFGISENQRIWRILGLTDEERKEAGIFSNDPRARMGIEREIYTDQEENLRALKVDPDPASVREDIEETQAFLDVLDAEFQSLYKEPIRPSPTD